MELNSFTNSYSLATIPRMAKKQPANDRHKKHSTSFRFRDEILELLELLSDKQRRTKTTVMEIALEKLGVEEGLWPLPPKQEKAKDKSAK